MAQRLKPAMQETQVRSLDRVDPLEKEMATHSSNLAWRIPWRRNLVGYSLQGRKESDTTEQLHFYFFICSRAIAALFSLPECFFSSIQSLSYVLLFATPWTASCQASLSINSRSLLKLKSIALVMPSNHLILCHPLFLSPSIFPSIRAFSNDSVPCIR